MSHCINEITEYFSDRKELPLEDQLIYYKLVAIFHDEEVDISDAEIKKIKCVKLLYDYRYKKKLRAIDVITAGDFPITMVHVMKFSESFSYEELKKLYDLAKEYERKNCRNALKDMMF